MKDKPHHLKKNRWSWQLINQIIILTIIASLSLTACNQTPQTPVENNSENTTSTAPPTKAPTKPPTPLPPTTVPDDAQSQSSPVATNIPPTTSPTPASILGIGSIVASDKDNMQMVYVPEGAFTMGSEDGDEDEMPVHSLYLDAFWIDQTEVTNAMFASFLNDINSQGGDISWFSPENSQLENSDDTWVSQKGFEEHPATAINWYGAEAYCNWAGKRLPTEAEWEKAARGTDKRNYPWGKSPDWNRNIDCDKARYGSCGSGTVPVGSYPSADSPYQALDMAGNAWEWVADWYADDYYDKSPNKNPTGPDTGTIRVMRGGAWHSSDTNVRTTYRGGDDPTISDAAYGFRCALSQEDQELPAGVKPIYIPTATPLPTNTADPNAAPTQKPQAGSTPETTIIDTMTSEIDNMNLVYVPEGDFLMGTTDENIDYAIRDLLSRYPNLSHDSFPSEKPPRQVNLDAFWIDQTEVTNAMYQKCIDDNVCEPPATMASRTRESYFDNPEYKDHPVIHINWTQAETYCAWAGRRLPTEAEWEKAARGTDGRLYPWGNEPPADNLLNVFQNVGDTSLVGNYPDGASPYGALDMAGNVAEWTADWYEKLYYENADDTNPSGPSTGQERVVRGGGWSGTTYFVRVTNRHKLKPTKTDGQVGFRCVLSANDTANSLSTTKPIAEDITEQVEIPAGEFVMGSTEREAEQAMKTCIQLNDLMCVEEDIFGETPQHNIYLDAFNIDKTEVTNAMYEQCVQAGTCNPPQQIYSYNISDYYNNPQYADYPVVYVNWNQASAYCQWAGKRLPTEAEWEKAARGTDGRIYPWGDNQITEKLLNAADINAFIFFAWANPNIDDGYQETSPTGHYPDGASPYGALDMAGNVSEWVADWHDPTYYLNSPTENPPGPTSGDKRVIRGGSWFTSQIWVRTTARLGYEPGFSDFNIGFRCASS